MSSNESNSNSSPTPAAPEAQPRNSAAIVTLSLILLGALVWAMAPSGARFQPSPLRPVPPGCPKTLPDFVPTDATEIPGVDLSSLSKTQRNRVLFRVNMEPCPCSCNTSIVACRASHPTCPLCKDLVEKITAEESVAKIQQPEAKRQEPEAKRQK